MTHPFAPLPGRPKGMHESTYERLSTEYLVLAHQLEKSLADHQEATVNRALATAQRMHDQTQRMYAAAFGVTPDQARRLTEASYRRRER